jgi:hypothetical protein
LPTAAAISRWLAPASGRPEQVILLQVPQGPVELPIGNLAPIPEQHSQSGQER